MTILSRNKLSSYSPPSFEGSNQIGLTEAKRGDPSSAYFEYPKDLMPLNAAKLTKWLWVCHNAAGLEVIKPFNRHLRQAKKLIENHDHEILVKAVKQASLRARHPFTFKFVERFL